MRLRPGEHALIRAHLVFHSADRDNIGHLKPEDRECLFADEQDQRYAKPSTIYAMEGNQQLVQD